MNVNAAPSLKVPFALAVTVPRSVRWFCQYILTVSNGPKLSPWTITVLPTGPELGSRISSGVKEKSAAPSFPLLWPTAGNSFGPYSDRMAGAEAVNEPSASAMAQASMADPMPWE